MRIYGKFSTTEYCTDDVNAVPFIHVSFGVWPAKISGLPTWQKIPNCNKISIV
jgi:hypothetical protein